MYPTTYLECFHLGAWQRIGWAASTPKEVADLEAHGADLASAGGYYRLVQPSIYADAPPTVVREYRAVTA